MAYYEAWTREEREHKKTKELYALEKVKDREIQHLRTRTLESQITTLESQIQSLNRQNALLEENKALLKDKIVLLENVVNQAQKNNKEDRV